MKTYCVVVLIRSSSCISPEKTCCDYSLEMPPPGSSSEYNLCFPGEISLCGYPILPGAMLSWTYVYICNLQWKAKKWLLKRGACLIQVQLELSEDLTIALL